MDAHFTTDQRLADLAGRQWGVVARPQCFEIGLTRDAIRRRLQAGRLHRVHLGVYAVGHATLTVDGRRLAAVLAAGPGAALSHRSAAAAWGLRPAGGRWIDVTVPANSGRTRIDGVRLHRSRTLAPDETVHRGPLRLTTPSRTLLDLAAVVGRPYLEAAVRQADTLDLFDLRELRALLAAHARQPGAKALRALVDRAGTEGLAVTLSDLEIAFRQLCAERGLPEPRPNATILGRRRDFVWPAGRLVVEVDSYRWHRGRTAFERDRLRDQELVAAGWRVLRVTDRQVAHEPNAVAALLRPLVATPGPATSRRRRRPAPAPPRGADGRRPGGPWPAP